ncbi:MAG: transketolase [Clostridia bacterium]|nr:transketolase [Clostridia bacterium]
MRNSFVQDLTLEAEKNPNIVLLSGDLGSNCLEVFWNKFPDRFFNCGIAEQNMMLVAAGLAMEGKKVFVYSIGNFDSLRVLEMIRNDICYMNLDVNIISVGAGLEYGKLGFSHHSTEDVSALRAMPNMSVFSPATAKEMKGVTKKMMETTSPCYVRLNKKSAGDFGSSACRVSEIISGTEVAFVASGAIVTEALAAAEILKSKGVSAGVYSFPVIKPRADKAILDISAKYKYIVAMEEHTVVGGFGSSVAEVLAENSAKCGFKMIGIQDEFAPLVGDRNHLRKQYGMDAESVAKAVLKALK